MEPMKITFLRLNDLALEGAEFANPRVHIDSRGIAELADSIATKGLHDPLQVWRTKQDGHIVNVVVDGGRRLRAIRKLVAEKRANGLELAVPCRFVDAKSIEDAIGTALVGNIQRVDLSSYEIAKEMAKLKELGMSGKDIAASVGKSQAWVSKQLSAFAKCSDWVKKEWKQRKLPDDDVFTLSKLDEAEQNKRLKTIMEHRGDGNGAAGKPSAKARGKARRAAKESDGAPKERTVRPAPDKLERYAQLAKRAKKNDRYVQGMRDAFLFALGKLGPGEFAREWTVLAKECGFYQTDATPEKRAVIALPPPTESKRPKTTEGSPKPASVPPKRSPAAKAKKPGKKSAAKKVLAKASSRRKK